MDPNDYHTIENFVKGMISLSEKLADFSPDHIIAPMIGAVPFIDVLSIIDSQFENDKVAYLPASNKIKDVRSVMRDWFCNFLKEHYHGEPIRLVSLDEVVSGSSLVRVYKQAQAAIQQIASDRMIEELKQYHTPQEIDNLEGAVKQRLREEVAARINYFPFGVVDDGLRRKKDQPFTREYQKLIDEGKTASVHVGHIPTMDRPDFFPLAYRRVSTRQGHFFYPTIENFSVSPNYIHFLRTVASIMGKNPEEVTFRNMAKILESGKFLSERFRGDY